MKKAKQLLPVLLSLCMLLTLLPGAALAAESVAQIGETPYTDLAKALEAATEGDTIKLVSDVNLGGDKKIDIGSGVRLELGGHRLAIVEPGQLTGAGTYVFATGSTLILDKTPYIGTQGVLAVTAGSLEIAITNYGDGDETNDGMHLTVPADAVLTVQGPNQPLGTHEGNYLNGIHDIISVDGTLKINKNVKFANSGIIQVNGSLNVAGTLFNYNNANKNQDLVSRIQFGPDASLMKTGTVEGLNTGAVAGKHFKWSPEDLSIHNFKGAWKEVVAESYDGARLSGYFGALADALHFAGSGDTIELLDDVKLGVMIELEEAKNLTIDLKGTKLTTDNNLAIAFKISNGSLTMKDSGESKGSFTASGEAFRVAGEKIAPADSAKHPKVVIDAGLSVVSDTNSCIYIYGVKAAAEVYGSLTSHGSYATIRGNGNPDSAGTTIQIYEGAVVKSNFVDGMAMYIPQDGVLNIYGGLIEGHSCLEVKSGIVRIQGGTFKAKAASTSHAPSSDGSSTWGYAFALVNNAKYVSGADAAISGGYFSGPVAMLNDDGATAVSSTSLSISGGHYTSDPSAYLSGFYVSGISDQAGYAFQVKPALIDNVLVKSGATAVNELALPAGAAPMAEADEATLLSLAGQVVPAATDTGLCSTAGNLAAQLSTATEEEAIAALDAAGISLEHRDIIIVVQPKLEVTPVYYDAAKGELTLDIKAVYDTIATTDANNMSFEGDGQNAVKLNAQSQTLPVAVGTPVTIRTQIPAAMAVLDEMGASYQSLHIKHVKDNNQGSYYYPAAVSQESDNYYATFTLTRGFSSFTLMAADERSLTVNFGSNVAEATYSITQVGSSLPSASQDGYTFKGWSFAGVTGTYQTLTDSLWTAMLGDTAAGANKTLNATAQFSYNGGGGGGGGGGSYYMVTATAGTGGSISPTRESVASGKSLSITITPAPGYKIASLTLGAKAVALSELKAGAAGTYIYKLENIKAKTDVAVAFTRSQASMANFILDPEFYTDGMYADVDDDLWYGANEQACVKTATLLGILEGYGEKRFGPEEQLKLSEAIKIACVVHSIYYDNGYEFTQGQPWYQVYLDYAVANGIIAATDFADYGAVCTRAQAAYLFAHALPAKELAAINTVAALPDVSAAGQYAEEIFLFYRAGVLTGNDELGSFGGSGAFTRAQAAAIAARLCILTERVSLNF